MFVTTKFDLTHIRLKKTNFSYFSLHTFFTIKSTIIKFPNNYLKLLSGVG